MSYEEKNESNTETRDSRHGDCMVTVSCIVYNHRGVLRQALESFLMQETDFDYEIVVHDDASTDGSIEILKEYEEKYPGIMKVMYESENQYSKGTRNISGAFNFPRAKGRYIAMCEGDDYWTDKLKLRKQFDFMEAHPDHSLCCHAARIISQKKNFLGPKSVRPWRETREIKAREVISGEPHIPTASMFMRSEYVRELPDWYHECPVGDIPLQLYLLTKGKVWYMNEIMSAYRMNSEGSWQSDMDGGEKGESQAKWEEHFAAMKKLYLAFNEESSCSYSDACEEALARLRFQIDLKEGKAEAVLDPANALFVKELPWGEAMLQKLKAYDPKVYELLRKLYHMAGS